MILNNSHHISFKYPRILLNVHQNICNSVSDFLVEVGGWSVDREHLAIALVVITLHQWELDRRVVELLDVCSTGLLGDDFLDLDDLLDKIENKLTNCYRNCKLFSYLD